MAGRSSESHTQIEQVVRRMMAHYFAPTPARVVAITVQQKASGRADIQMLINPPRTDGKTLERSYVEAALVPDAPVMVPSSGASDQILRLEVGDLGLWIPTMYSLDDLLDTDVSGPVNVTDPEQQTVQSGFFLPLTLNRTLTGSAASADRMIYGDDVRVGDNPDGVFSLASKSSVQQAVDLIWAQLTAAGAAADYAVAPVNAPNISGTDHLKGN